MRRDGTAVYTVFAVMNGIWDLTEQEVSPAGEPPTDGRDAEVHEAVTRMAREPLRRPQPVTIDWSHLDPRCDECLCERREESSSPRQEEHPVPSGPIPYRRLLTLADVAGGLRLSDGSIIDDAVYYEFDGSVHCFIDGVQYRVTSTGPGKFDVQTMDGLPTAKSLAIERMLRVMVVWMTSSPRQEHAPVPSGPLSVLGDIVKEKRLPDGTQVQFAVWRECDGNEGRIEFQVGRDKFSVVVADGQISVGQMVGNAHLSSDRADRIGAMLRNVALGLQGGRVPPGGAS